ncbi:MAG: prepilin-type N-terminal cleavage/methylation domain-containing protein [Candidatus Riflebacteria bacterium]|jgi:prepilin-type N-terminal cleavage/methylation domain-containing protein|nr:prepilin-type N-terminal cleavage/methylation domain-containing protein [Candidatus Riflebacteria bacterium]
MLICCSKISQIKSDKSHLRLHRHRYNNNGCYKKSGFTIIEILIVVLIIGILSSAAIGSYSGAVQDTRYKSAQDRIQTFFQSCKDRARLRKQNIKIIYNQNAKSLVNPESTTSFLKVPELCIDSIPKLIEIDKDGRFSINGKEKHKLDLSLTSPNGKTATITILL